MGRIDRMAVIPFEHDGLERLYRVEVNIGKKEERYLLRIASDEKSLDFELEVIEILDDALSIATSKELVWEARDLHKDGPMRFYKGLSGEPLIDPILRDEVWTDEVYLDGVREIQGVDRELLGQVENHLNRDAGAEHILDQAYQTLLRWEIAGVGEFYGRLKETMPELPGSTFTTGNLSPANFWVDQQQIVAVMSCETAGFGDPLYQFLLPFIQDPRLQYRGYEERYCHKLGYNLTDLSWYRALIYFDFLATVTTTGQPYYGYTEDGLRDHLAEWLERKIVIPV